MYVCVSWSNKFSFFGKSDVLFSCYLRFEIRPFAYNRENASKQSVES